MKIIGPIDQTGLTTSQWQSALTLLAAQLGKDQMVEVYLFGSRADGRQRKYSDVDLLLCGSVDHRQLLQMRDALEESDLPFKFDLVLDHEVLPDYRSSIDRSKKLIAKICDK